MSAKAISGFHAHVYFDVDSRETAVRIYDSLARDFAVRLGRLHDRPVGPHTKPMFQITIELDQFADIVPWLMVNRDGLSIFVHPNTGDAVNDHENHPLWMGDPLPIDIEMIRVYEGGKQ